MLYVGFELLHCRGKLVLLVGRCRLLHRLSIQGSGCAGSLPQRLASPPKSDMQTLIYSVARVSSDSLVGQALKSTTGWSNDSNGTDLFGFSAIPTGYRGSAPRGPNYVAGGGGYVDLRSTTCFWTSQAVYSESWAYSLRLRSNENTAELVYQYWQKSYRCSVRCVKD